MDPSPTSYPARLEIDYQESFNRLTTALRLFVALPILIVSSLIVGTSSQWQDPSTETTYQLVLGGTGVITLPLVLLIVFRQKYPRWWFDWNLEFTRFSNRIAAYLALLTDQYPSTDEEQSVHVELDYPDVPQDLNRWLPLVKWLLVIPHFIVLLVLGIAAVFAVIFAWFAIVFTGRYPISLFTFVVGGFRWGLRVQAYAFLLVTDRYPPFSLE